MYCCAKILQMVKPEFEVKSWWIDTKTGNAMMPIELLKLVQKMEMCSIEEVKKLVENLQIAAATHFNNDSLSFSEEASEILALNKETKFVPSELLLELAEQIQHVITKSESL